MDGAQRHGRMDEKLNDCIIEVRLSMQKEDIWRETGSGSRKAHLVNLVLSYRGLLKAPLRSIETSISHLKMKGQRARSSTENATESTQARSKPMDGDNYDLLDRE